MTVAVRPAADADAPAIRALVTGAGLPVAGLDGLWRAWVAVRGDDVVGTAGMERHGDALLLRSVAVAPHARGQGVGVLLVTAALAAAGPAPVALLTETAAGWFPRFGFAPVERSRLDPALTASPVLSGACPASAVAMVHAGG